MPTRRIFILTAIMAPLGVAAAKFIPAPHPSVVQDVWPADSGITAHVTAAIKADLHRFVGQKIRPPLLTSLTKSTNDVLQRLEREGYIAQAGSANTEAAQAGDGTINVTATFRPTQSLYYVNTTFTLCSGMPG